MIGYYCILYDTQVIFNSTLSSYINYCYFLLLSLPQKSLHILAQNSAAHIITKTLHSLTSPPSYRISTGSQPSNTSTSISSGSPLGPSIALPLHMWPISSTLPHQVRKHPAHTESMATFFMAPLWTGLLTPDPIFPQIPHPLLSKRMSTIQMQIFKSGGYEPA